MEFNEYQQKASATAKYDKKYKIIYPTLGLTGEAGEVADKIKKVLRDNDGEFSEDKKQEIKKEIGDVLWYIANLSLDLGFDLEDVAISNLNKLADRQKRDVISGNGDNR